MPLLRVLTLVYAAVLVLALATALIVIAVYLWRIASTLGDVRTALTAVRDRTAPLQQRLQVLQALQPDQVNALEHAATALEQAHETVVQRSEPATATS